ncbi:hypothetical protein ABPG72_003777 [Tetrahymena utriculariae]
MKKSNQITYFFKSRYFQEFCFQLCFPAFTFGGTQKFKHKLNTHKMIDISSFQNQDNTFRLLNFTLLIENNIDRKVLIIRLTNIGLNQKILRKTERIILK